MKGFKKSLLCAAIFSVVGGTVNAANTIDMVVAIDESGSMSGEHNAFIGSYIQNLDNVLNTQQVTVNRYGLGGFGGSIGQLSSANEAGRETGSALYRHFNLSSGVDSIWGTANDFNSVTSQLQTSGGTEDGYRMVDYVLRNYQFRNSAGASIFLITDEDRDVDTDGTPATSGLPQGQTIYNNSGTPSSISAANMPVMQQMLSDKNIVLHSVVDQRFTDSQGNTAIAVVGADPTTGFAFVKDPVTGVVTKVQGYVRINSFDTTDSDYSELSLATGGTVMDISELRSVYTDVTALNSLSQELAKIVASISQGQGTVVGVDCSVATGPARNLCAALLGSSQLSSVRPSGTNAQMQAQLNQMLPHATLAGRAAILRGGSQYRRILFSRISSARQGLRASSVPLSLTGGNGFNISDTALAGIGSTGGGASADSASDINFFVRGTYGEARQSTDAGINGYNSETYSIALGADTQINKNVLLGASLGYISTDSDVRGIEGSGSDANTYMLSTYGSYEFSPSWYLDGVLSYGHVTLDTTRTVAGDRLVGDTHADQWNLSVGVTREMEVSDLVTLRPFGQLHYANVSIDGYSEKGGAAALLYDGNTIESLVSEIGIGAERQLNNGWAVNGSLAWEHEFNNDSRSIRTAFVDDPANTIFQVKGIDGQRDYGRVSFGVSKVIERERSFYFNVDSVVGNSDYSDYTLELKYRQSF